MLPKVYHVFAWRDSLQVFYDHSSKFTWKDMDNYYPLQGSGHQ